MDDQDRQLRERLERLDADLKRTKSVDEEGRAILLNLQVDVQNLLARSGEVSSRDHVIAARFREGIQHFEVTHPTLVALMEQVVDALSAIGI